MNEIKKLKSKPFPQMIQDFAAQNFNLKVLCSVLLGITFFSLLLILFLVKRGPTVIALDNTGEVARIETKVTDLQVQAAAKEYLSYRYSWDDKTFSSQIKKATFFVHPSLTKAFEKSMIEVRKFVAEKKVSQRVYAREVKVDFKEKTITLTADRITEFDALKAATQMNLTLHFAVDDRTVVNPWGVYITKEVEGGGQ